MLPVWWWIGSFPLVGGNSPKLHANLVWNLRSFPNLTSVRAAGYTVYFSAVETEDLVIDPGPSVPMSTDVP